MPGPDITQVQTVSAPTSGTLTSIFTIGRFGASAIRFGLVTSCEAYLQLSTDANSVNMARTYLTDVTTHLVMKCAAGSTYFPVHDVMMAAHAGRIEFSVAQHSGYGLAVIATKL